MSSQISWIFLELGAAVVGLAVLTRLAGRIGVSAIPLYLLGGLAFGNGGLVPLRFSEEFVHIGSEIGVILLLFMLGLESSAEELRSNLRIGFPAGLVDLVLNFTPGLVAGLMMGWGPLASVLLGGVTTISSSGIVAKVLAETGRTDCPETPTILTILVLEDLATAVFLPLVAVLLLGQGIETALVSVLVALAIVGGVLLVAVRQGRALSEAVFHQSDEVGLLTIFGLVLVVAGAAEQFKLSGAIGAFLLGITLSGPVVVQAHRLIGPLRDLFAAIFFLFFGLQIRPADLPPVLPTAALLGVATVLTKLLTGWWAARRAGVGVPGRLRAGAALVARGEFSIVIAGLGVGAGLELRLGPLSAAYVLLMAVIGPILARLVDRTRGPKVGRPIESRVPGPGHRPSLRVVESDGTVFERVASTGHGVVSVITEMNKEGNDLVLNGLHIDGPGARSLGLRALRELAKDLGRQHGATRVIINGGVRTTGAKPGHTPRTIFIPVGETP